MIHVAVHAADHQVEFRHRVVGEIHGAVFQDVALQAREDAQPQAVAVQLAHVRAKSTARASSSPLVMASDFEWSVMAMYS